MTDCSTQYDFKGYVYEDGSATIHGTLSAQDRARTPLTRSDVSSISYNVIKQSDYSAILTDQSLTIADVLEDTLDVYDNNFHVVFPATAFPDGDENYIIDLTINLASGYTTKSKGILYAIETGTGT